MDKRLTAPEAADRLGYHVRHLYRLMRSSMIEAEHFWAAVDDQPGQSGSHQGHARQGRSFAIPKAVRSNPPFKRTSPYSNNVNGANPQLHDG